MELFSHFHYIIEIYSMEAGTSAQLLAADQVAFWLFHIDFPSMGSIVVMCSLLKKCFLLLANISSQALVLGNKINPA